MSQDVRLSSTRRRRCGSNTTQPSHSKAGRTRNPGAALNVPLRESTEVDPGVGRAAERVLRVPIAREGEGRRAASASRALVVMAAAAMARSPRAGAQTAMKRMRPGLGEGGSLQIPVMDELAKVRAAD